MITMNVSVTTLDVAVQQRPIARQAGSDPTGEIGSDNLWAIERQLDEIGSTFTSNWEW